MKDEILYIFKRTLIDFFLKIKVTIDEYEFKKIRMFLGMNESNK